MKSKLSVLLALTPYVWLLVATICTFAGQFDRAIGYVGLCYLALIFDRIESVHGNMQHRMGE